MGASCWSARHLPGTTLHGQKLIGTVESEITDLDKMRAFGVAMATAITVIIASQLALPVTSTHVAVAGVFGVGFLREYLKMSYPQMMEEIRAHHAEDSPEVIELFLERFETANVTVKGDVLRELKQRTGKTLLHKKERKGLGQIQRHELVKRSLLLLIAAAWVITVPVAGVLGVMFFRMIRGMMSP